MKKKYQEYMTNGTRKYQATETSFEKVHILDLADSD